MADFNLVVGAEIGSSTQQFKKDIQSIVENLNDVKIKIKLDIDKKQIDSLKKQITDIANSLNVVTGGVTVNTSSITTRSSGIAKLTGDTKAASAAQRDLARATKEANAALSSNDVQRATKKYDNLLKQMNRSLGWTRAKNGKTSLQYSQIENEVNLLRDANAVFLSSGGTQSDLDKFNAQIGKSSALYSTLSREIMEAGENTKSFADRFGGLGKKFASWFSVSQIIMAAIRSVRQMVQASVELDSAFAQLKIVTGATDEEMERFADTTFELSKRLGQSATDVAKSIETFSRLGYGLQDASSLAEYATILANTAAVSTEEATTGLTSIIKGYGMDVTNAEHVADVLIEVGQKYAVSAGEMMEAYQRSGAALNAANTDFEKSAGLIAAANASVQDASIVGKVMPSITVM